MTAASFIQQPLVWPLGLLAIAFLSSLIGGALSGIVIAGKQFGAQLAMQMGGLFGLLAGVPGIAIALIVLALIG